MKSISPVILIYLLVLLSACNTAPYSYWRTETGGVLFEEDFSLPRGDWAIFTTPDAAGALADGTYILSIPSPSYSSWSLSGKKYKDIRAEVDAARLGGSSANMYGLTCRADQEGNFYFFIISSDGYYAIGKMEIGSFSLLGQDMMAYSAAILLDEGTNHLRLDCVETTLTGYVNGQMVAVTGDGTFSSGDTGVMAGSFDSGGVVIGFDNFTLYKP